MTSEEWRASVREETARMWRESELENAQKKRVEKRKQLCLCLATMLTPIMLALLVMAFLGM